MTHPVLLHQRGLPRNRGCGVYLLQHLFWKCNACSPANRCRAAPAPRGATSPARCQPFASAAVPPSCRNLPSLLSANAHCSHRDPNQPRSHPSGARADAEGINFTHFNNTLEMGKTFFFKKSPFAIFHPDSLLQHRFFLAMARVGEQGS